MTVEQILASCFNAYMKLSETSISLTLDLHQVFLHTSLLRCLQNVFMVRNGFMYKFAQLLVLLHYEGQRATILIAAT